MDKIVDEWTVVLHSCHHLPQSIPLIPQNPCHSGLGVCLTLLLDLRRPLRTIPPLRHRHPQRAAHLRALVRRAPVWTCLYGRLLSKGLRRCQETLLTRRCEGRSMQVYSSEYTIQRWWWTLLPGGFLLLTTSCLTTMMTLTLMRITIRQGQDTRGQGQKSVVLYLVRCDVAVFW